MPLSLSPAPDMLATIRAYLETEILPGLRDPQRFNVRVAANMLAMIERELTLGAAATAEELARLRDLVGADGTFSELTRELARAIRAGEIAGDDPRLLDHLRRSTEDALRINNPRWLEQP
jgi:hypothetical protein